MAPVNILSFFSSHSFILIKEVSGLFLLFSGLMHGFFKIIDLTSTAAVGKKQE